MLVIYQACELQTMISKKNHAIASFFNDCSIHQAAITRFSVNHESDWQSCDFQSSEDSFYKKKDSWSEQASFWKTSKLLNSRNMLRSWMFARFARLLWNIRAFDQGSSQAELIWKKLKFKLTDYCSIEVRCESLCVYMCVYREWTFAIARMFNQKAVR